MASPRLTWKIGSTWFCAALLVAGCGGAQQPTDTAKGSSEASAPASDDSAPAAEAESEAEDAPSGGFPTKCHKTDPCVPPPKFVEGLCSDTYAGVALHM